MKIDVISDLHYSHWTTNNTRKINLFIKEYIQPKSDYIIIAGDISNSIADTLSFLKVLKKQYKRVIIVWGNHDYYFSNSEMNKFDNYIDRMKYFEDEVRKLGIDLLTGNIINIEDVNIGGTGAWYDFSYIKKIRPMLSNNDIAQNWSYYMNDSNYIKGLKKNTNIESYNSIINLSNQEKEKISKIFDKVDIMVTHISPLNEPRFAIEKYRMGIMTGAYFFDGLGFGEYTTAKYWIYGHTHDEQKFDVFDKIFISNPLGYPFEKNKRKSIQIEL